MIPAHAAAEKNSNGVMEPKEGTIVTLKRILGSFLVMALSLTLVRIAQAEEQGKEEQAGGSWQMASQGSDQPAGQPEQKGAPSANSGNRQPTAEEMKELMQGVMGPMMAQMISAMLQSMAKTLAEPQIAQNLATYTRNYYLALVDRGFTEEEALRIVTAAGFPSLGGKQ